MRSVRRTASFFFFEGPTQKKNLFSFPAINDFDSFYVQSTSPSDIAGLSQPEYDELSQDYKSVFNRLVPLTNYQTISFKQSSRIVWSISPPARANLIADLRNTNISSFVRAYMTFDRESSLYPLADGYFTRNLNTSEAIALADVLEFSNSLNSLVLDGVIPMFLESAATGQIRYALSLLRRLTIVP